MLSSRNAWLGLAVVLAITGQAATSEPAAALSCASDPVTVRGEFAAFQWSARAKARATWRHRVRIAPTLGAAFADWGLAKDPIERCIRNEGRMYCIFTGTPCRK